MGVRLWSPRPTLMAHRPMDLMPLTAMLFTVTPLTAMLPTTQDMDTVITIPILMLLLPVPRILTPDMPLTLAMPPRHGYSSHGYGNVGYATPTSYLYSRAQGYGAQGEVSGRYVSPYTYAPHYLTYAN